MRNILIAAVIVALANSPIASATPIGGQGPDFGNAFDSIKTDIAKQNRALNSVYRKLISRLHTARRERLISSERLWIRYRDAECEFQGSRVIGGPQGIIAQAQEEDKLRCLLEETRNRTKRLRGELKFEQDGTLPPLHP